MKTLVFIVAYNAENHIEDVLNRIPSNLYNNINIDILIIDDCSKDKTSLVAKEWVKLNKLKNLKILKNNHNQKYGGNQKLGYTYAINNAYDFVILLHGDGQYAPDLLNHFIDTYRKEKSDIVLGSRLMNLKSAIKGGMPIYKLIGNKILTKFQNILTNRNISEYHTGYRGYSIKFLKSIPFLLNTNEFHFDTEILLQAFHINAKITEFSIPTHYGNEVCHVNGLSYAMDIVLSTLQFKLHKMGMFVSLKFRNLDSNEHYKNKIDSNYSSHSIALKEIYKLNLEKVLDLGSGPGYIARELEENGIQTVSVDLYPPMKPFPYKFRKANLEKDPIPWGKDNFSLVLLLDIIEHLSEPENFLLNLRNDSPLENYKIMLSTPNVAFFAIRLNLLFGRFNYASRGILDITHKRLFTKSSLLKLAKETGMEIEWIKPIPAPFRAVMPGKLGSILEAFALILCKIFPGLFAFQYLMLMKPNAGIKKILDDAEVIY
ncbi:MAG: glycosyltransferase [Leptospira sp.]|nr:glycosyltransferase [Leptospira sp.]NCS94813.1 glycosyltransferase [Leptospira sp.]